MWGAQSRAQAGTVILTPNCPTQVRVQEQRVLFENQLLQIGVKSEFRQNLGGSWGQ